MTGLFPDFELARKMKEQTFTLSEFLERENFRRPL